MGFIVGVIVIHILTLCGAVKLCTRMRLCVRVQPRGIPAERTRVWERGTWVDVNARLLKQRCAQWPTRAHTSLLCRSVGDTLVVCWRKTTAWPLLPLQCWVLVQILPPCMLVGGYSCIVSI